MAGSNGRILTHFSTFIVPILFPYVSLLFKQVELVQLRGGSLDEIIKQVERGPGNRAV